MDQAVDLGARVAGSVDEAPRDDEALAFATAARHLDPDGGAVYGQRAGRAPSPGVRSGGFGPPARADWVLRAS